MESYRAEFTDFPEAPEAKELLAHGFEDTSWHNDICPSWTRTFPAEAPEGARTVELRVWIEYPDPNQRECGPETPRYMVILYDGYFEPLGALFESNDWVEAKRYALAHIFFEPEVDGYFALVMGEGGDTPAFADARQAYSIGIYRTSGGSADSCEMVEELDRMDRAACNAWYAEHVGYRPDDEAPTDMKQLLALVAGSLLFKRAEADGSRR